MYLSHLSLTNFRNFVQLELDLPPGIVVIFGANAQGKTSLLEAVYLLVIARSFRAENEHEVVYWDTDTEKDSAVVAGTIEKENERLRVYVGYQCIPLEPVSPTTLGRRDRPFRVRKQISVSRLKRTAAALVGVVNGVLFNAEDIGLVNGPPSVRRRYLDILLSQVDPAYLNTLQRYQRVLQQRNRLLRSLQERKANGEELIFWDEELTREGSWIIRRRHEAMEPLADLCVQRHSELTRAAERLSLEYRSSVGRDGHHGLKDEIEEEFRACLEASRKKELGIGSTVVGPHRDDFRLMVNGVDMGTYASRGQARTLALTLRLAEAEYLALARGEGPIVLLDDVLSEMDSSRRSRVLDNVVKYQQVIITTTDLEPIRKSSIPVASYFEVEGGRITNVEPWVRSPI